MIPETDLLSVLKETGAILEGHFLLTSGNHSNVYIEKFRVLENPAALEQVCEAMFENLIQLNIELVIGAAVGGILLAGGVGRLLGVRHIFSERVDGKMVFRRGFIISPDTRVAIVEDVVTTGGSVDELIDLVVGKGAIIPAVIAMVDRSATGIRFKVPTFSLLTLPSQTWTPTECPLCKRSVPLTSRGRSGK